VVVIEGEDQMEVLPPIAAPAAPGAPTFDISHFWLADGAGTNVVSVFHSLMV
jgi:hypothetical protein